VPEPYVEPFRKFTQRFAIFSDCSFAKGKGKRSQKRNATMAIAVKVLVSTLVVVALTAAVYTSCKVCFVMSPLPRVSSFRLDEHLLISAPLLSLLKNQRILLLDDQHSVAAYAV
jgi:predicted neutral ceramidase superfamily lipid hydrolase